MTFEAWSLHQGREKTQILFLFLPLSPVCIDIVFVLRCVTRRNPVYTKIVSYIGPTAPTADCECWNQYHLGRSNRGSVSTAPLNIYSVRCKISGSGPSMKRKYAASSPPKNFDADAYQSPGTRRHTGRQCQTLGNRHFELKALAGFHFSIERPSKLYSFVFMKSKRWPLITSPFFYAA